jgi:hypothetical protein
MTETSLRRTADDLNSMGFLLSPQGPVYPSVAGFISLVKWFLETSENPQ